MIKNILVTAIAAVLLAASPVIAETKVDVGGGKGLVVVDVSNVDVAVLEAADIEILDDNTVQVPINVAATLCNTQVNVIASDNEQGNKTCEATAEGVAAFEQL
jgi:hypothetical protein